ncbi:MAG TPA: prepilin-type N-terminal cleavage/methylation domain-containing protein [Pyrinomonadaceae bacterium]|nr:prepilin-type N-terminal cleavage/methylation domain-containing protein [Pyrinomonadaceae bacterium]
MNVTDSRLRPDLATNPARETREQAGFSLIELLIVVAIIGIVAAIAIPNLLASRRAANEASAISAVRTISSAEASYFSSHNSFGTLADLKNSQMLDAQLAGATAVGTAKNGYIFGVLVTGGGSGYVAGAAPATSAQGNRNFSSDEPGVIYVHPGNAANVPVSTAGGTAFSN